MLEASKLNGDVMIKVTPPFFFEKTICLKIIRSSLYVRRRVDEQIIINTEELKLLQKPS